MAKNRRPRVNTYSYLSPAPLSNARYNLRDVVKRTSSPPLTLFEDRRSFNPEGRNAPALTFQGTPATVVARNKPKLVKKAKRKGYGYDYSLKLINPAILTFHAPWNVLTCVRRKRRRETLHALYSRAKGGISGIIRRQARRTWRSAIACK